MLEGLFGSMLTKAAMSVAAAFGLFGGLAVVGVLPVLGDNASDTVIVDAIAVVETSEDIVAVNPVLELPSVGGITTQLPLVDDLASGVPGIVGITSNNAGAVDAGLPVLGLLGTLVNSLTGSVEAVVASLPVAGGVLPGLPVAGGVNIPRSSASAPGLEAVSRALNNLPDATSVVPSLPLVGELNGTARNLPLVDELLRSARGAIGALLPAVVVAVR